jgi:hypothetical protein
MPSPLRRRVAWAALPAALGLWAGQLALALAPDADPGDAAGVALEVGLAVVLVWLVVRVATAMAWGRDLEVGFLPAPLRRVRPGAWPVLGASSALVALALLGQPSRLAVTLYGYVLLAGASWWVVRRGAGPRAGAAAVCGLAALTLVGAQAQLPTMRFVEDWRPGSPFKWAVGWPTEAWRLRHTVQLDAPADPEHPLRLRLFLAQAYEGPGRVYATVNGREVTVTQEASELHVEVPGEVAAGATRLEVVLRQSPVDPRLRVLATRWPQGASLGREATSFGDGRSWLPGTFDDEAGRRQPGVLAVHVEGLDG